MKVLTLVVLYYLNLLAYAEFPSDIKRCHFGDVDCIKETIYDIFTNHADGHQGLNLPQIEPYHISSLVVSQKGNSSVTMELFLEDVEINGILGIKVERVVGFGNDPEKSKYQIFAKAPKLQLRGKYKMNGRILLLPITGQGVTNNSLLNVEIGMKMKPRVYMKEGKKYVEMEKFKLRLNPENVTFSFSNLFNGDQALSETINDFLQENSLLIWNETKDAFIIGISEVFKSIVNSVLSKFSYEEMFLSE